METDFLCTECRQLDIAKVFSWRENYVAVGEAGGLLVANVGRRYREQTRSECRLCRILARTRVALGSFGKISESDDIRAFSFLRHFRGINLESAAGSKLAQQYPSKSIFLALVPSTFEGDVHGLLETQLYTDGVAVCYDDDHQLPQNFRVRQIPSRFSPTLVKSWLSYCQRNHKRLCKQSQTPASNLKLVDTHLHSVVHAPPQASYLALSYVWGRTASERGERVQSSSRPQQLALNLPNVVRDAIAVTTALGYRYLWVDKFCIDQHDTVNKHQQVMQMDTIYENAVLTIIAAAGSDEHYGLPGVGSRARTVQECARYGRLTIISSLANPHDSICSSKWATRGWTFQEAMLSRRCLVFTDEQMYFECNAMNCCESVESNLDHIHRSDKSKLRECLRGGAFGRNDQQSFGRFDFDNLSSEETFFLFLSSLEDYSARDLRYDHDSLNAFTGLMRKYRRHRPPIMQVLGVPYTAGDGSGKQPGLFQTGWFLTGLTWRHSQGCWDGPNAPRPRNGFPSWTWAGWAGRAEYNYGFHKEYRRLSGRSVTRTLIAPYPDAISFELESGDVKGMRDIDYALSLDDRETSPLKILRLKGKAIPQSAITYDSKAAVWSIFGFRTELYLSQGPSTPTQLMHCLEEEDRWLCVFAGFTMEMTLGFILESQGETYIRAGLFLVHDQGKPLRIQRGMQGQSPRIFRIA